MKNKMPLDGLGLGHDSGSVHCDMLKMLCFRTAWGGACIVFDARSLSLFLTSMTASRCAGSVFFAGSCFNNLQQYSAT